MLPYDLKVNRLSYVISKCTLRVVHMHPIMNYMSNDVLKVSEKDVVKGILSYLEYIGVYAWRNNTGAIVSSYEGKKRFFKYGLKGSADIIGILPDGRFLAIECKANKNKLSVAQNQFLKNIKSNGGVAICAYSLDDVIEAKQNKWKSNI